MKEAAGRNIIKKLNIKSGRILFAILICLLVVSAIFLNILVVKVEQRFSLIGDLTGNSAYKIGFETKAVLNRLYKDVEIFVLADDASFTGDSYLVQANRMIKEYPANSTRITLDYVDYVLNPTFAAQYPDLDLEKGNILVTCEENTEQIKLSEMFNYTKNSDGNVVITASRAEEAITSAILKVISDVRINVALLKGNGVKEKEEFEQLLSKNGFILNDIQIATGSIDPSVDVAVLLAPQIDLSDESIKKIDDFLYNGGEYGKMLIYAADVTQDALPLTEAYLREWGVQVGEGAVFETKADRTYQSQPFYPVADYVQKEYQELLLDRSSPMLLPLSRPLGILFDVRDRQYTSELLSFAGSAGVRPIDAENFSPQDATEWGPMPALVLASRKLYSTDGSSLKKSDILVSSSTEMLDAFSIQNSSFANSEYIVKLINHTFGKEEGVTIVPKSLAGNILSVNTRQKDIIGIIFSIILPVCILAAGIVIYIVRRHK